MQKDERERLAKALAQRDGIMSLEGFESTPFRKKLMRRCWLVAWMFLQ